MGDYGFKIAKPGYDVKTATDTQTILSSKFNTLKMNIVGNFHIIVPGSTAANTRFAGTINHALGYVPAVFIYPSAGGTATTINSIPSDMDGTQPTSPIEIDHYQFSYELDNSNLVIYARTYGGGGTPAFWGTNSARDLTLKYYIFTQQIE